MMIKALIVEQLEPDGTLRSFKMQPGQGEDLVVAFADEYDEPRHGPFHFLDPRDEERFREGFATCRARRLSGRTFQRNGNRFRVETSWYGIPTERNWLSYYALSLPQGAIPRHLTITDPHSDRQYRRTVARDDERTRFVIVLECASRLGRFDFDLSCEFELDETEFSRAQYTDSKTDEYGRTGDDWKYWLQESESTKVQQFFLGSVNMGDNYTAGQVGAMGRGATASNTTFQQIWDQNRGSLDLEALGRELQDLRAAMRDDATTPEHDVALGEIAAAESAASDGNGPKALEHLKKGGQWALDVSTKIGVNVAGAAIRASMGL